MLLHGILLAEVNCCHNDLRTGRWENEGVCWTDLLYVEVELGLDIKIIIQQTFYIRRWKSIWRAYQILPSESHCRLACSID